MSIPSSWQPLIVHANDGVDIPFFEGNGVRFRILSRDTGHVMESYERFLRPGDLGTDPHIHSNTDEFFRILKGEVTIQVGSDEHVLSEGAMLGVPRGVPHAFWNHTAKSCLVQITFTPGLEHDEFFRGMAEAWATPENRGQEEINALRRRFGAYTCDAEGNPADGLPPIPVVQPG